MAENTKAKADPQVPTKRVVLRRERVLVIADNANEAKVAEALKAFKAKPGDLKVAWVVLGAGEGSKTQAIEQHAGSPGTPDAKLGAYKAPSATSWAGGELYDAPPLPLVERKPLDDAP